MKITRMAYDNDLNLTDITVEDYDGSEYELEVVRHGKWIDAGCYNECPFCHKAVDRYDDGGYLQDFKRCPECGAKLDLEG